MPTLCEAIGSDVYVHFTIDAPAVLTEDIEELAADTGVEALEELGAKAAENRSELGGPGQPALAGGRGRVDHAGHRHPAAALLRCRLRRGPRRRRLRPSGRQHGERSRAGAVARHAGAERSGSNAGRGRRPTAAPPPAGGIRRDCGSGLAIVSASGALRAVDRIQQRGVDGRDRRITPPTHDDQPERAEPAMPTPNAGARRAPRRSGSGRPGCAWSTIEAGDPVAGVCFVEHHGGHPVDWRRWAGPPRRVNS